MIASIIVPTFTRPQALVACLDALGRQDMPVEGVEIIIVDDGSTVPLDKAKSVAARMPNVRWITQRNTGPAEARNHGAREASAPILVFTDDDCLPLPDWARLMIARVEQRPDALVSGDTFNGLSHLICSEASQVTMEAVYLFFNADAEHSRFFTSNNMACRREEFSRHGGFDQRLRYAEDREFCDRWRTQGGSLLWDRMARIEHRHPQNFRKFLRLHLAYGRGAFDYHNIRTERGSGKMSDDMGFHREILSLLSETIGAREGVWRKVQLFFLFGFGQVANVLGYFVQRRFRKNEVKPSTNPITQQV